MVYIFVSVVVIGLILFFVSFFMDDRVQQLEEQLEQFSIATMQDTYQMKKKIKILEEELLTEDVGTTDIKNIPPALKDKPLLVQKVRSEEHTSELQSRGHIVCRLLLEKKKKQNT